MLLEGINGTARTQKIETNVLSDGFTSVKTSALAARQIPNTLIKQELDKKANRAALGALSIEIPTQQKGEHLPLVERELLIPIIEGIKEARDNEKNKNNDEVKAAVKTLSSLVNQTLSNQALTVVTLVQAIIDKEDHCGAKVTNNNTGEIKTLGLQTSDQVEILYRKFKNTTETPLEVFRFANTRNQEAVELATSLPDENGERKILALTRFKEGDEQAKYIRFEPNRFGLGTNYSHSSLKALDA